MFHLTREPKGKNTIPASRVPALFKCRDVMQNDAAKVAARTEVSECSARLSSHRVVFHEVSQGTAGSAGHSKNGAKRKGQLLHFT